ncbi:MAG: transcription elongation factor GreA [Nitrospinae bacterium]|nr:transcription elongation factor GreA [Nitrospinota bacterium]
MQAPLIRKLEAELEELNHELRITLPAELKRAADYGDLSENAEYDAAKERKRMVESRISILQKRISEILSININAIPTDRVGLGSTVTLEDLDSGDEVIYHFVFSEEVDPEKGKISLASPIGKGMVGRSVGDEITVTTPKGVRKFEVVELVTYHDKKEAGTL